MRGTYKRILVLVATLGLSACMASDLERAGVGAAVGGVTVAALNGNVATGVIIGVAGGALCDDAGICD